ncbi:hypothetical protein GALMADRAFT_242455 [Galerina marginata CBS 339.88]|uniref:Uncharacterized protein n=1 Tax=Galerina marginata (strain CBS 339.88) TaxID=685588 RepID=A0A067TAE1_GALM3|nr:hypothetical protein GALMADRAFT_242455 [Galerina marginata CBS 339.88]
MATRPSASTTSKAQTDTHEPESDVRRLEEGSAKDVITEEFAENSDLELDDGEQASNKNPLVEEPSPLVSLPADGISPAGIPDKHFMKAHSRTNTFGNPVQDDSTLHFML